MRLNAATDIHDRLVQEKGHRIASGDDLSAPKKAYLARMEVEIQALSGQAELALTRNRSLGSVSCSSGLTRSVSGFVQDWALIRLDEERFASMANLSNVSLPLPRRRKLTARAGTNLDIRSYMSSPYARPRSRTPSSALRRRTSSTRRTHSTASSRQARSHLSTKSAVRPALLMAGSTS